MRDSGTWFDATHMQHDPAGAAGGGNPASAPTPDLFDARRQMSEYRTAIERVRGELASAQDLAERIAASRAWRMGHRVSRIGRAAIGRPAVGDGAMPRLLARIEAAQNALPSASQAGHADPLVAVAPTIPPPPVSTPLSVPLEIPVDARGILRAGEPTGDTSIDVVVCVHDALPDVHECLTALLERSDRAFRLIVVDDGSGPATRSYLAEFAACNPAVELVHNDAATHGYTIAANIGLRVSTAAYVVLLNSDTRVTRGWLNAIVRAGEVDPAIGIIGPLSNAASHQSVPVARSDGDWMVNEVPSWADEEVLSLVLAGLPGEEVIDVPFLNGFCYAIRRSVLDAIGLLDEETFGSGYSEENDFSRRAARAGYRLVVTSRGYVFHAKSRSFGHADRKRLAKRNYQLFLEKHGESEIRALVEELEHNPSLQGVRASCAPLFADAVAMAAALPRKPTSFVLPGISAGGSGGSHSIFQEVSAMRRLGLPARILIASASWDRAMSVYPDHGDAFTAYDDESHLIELAQGDSVVVATHYTSVALVAQILRAHPAALGAYYVQDYEPLFAEPGSEAALRARESYSLIPGAVLFAKTRWLQRTLAAEEKIPVAKVAPSLDLQTFNARRRSRSDGLHLVAMLRPRTPRRSARQTLSALRAVAEQVGGDVRVTTFGCEQAAVARLGDEVGDHVGILSRSEMANLLRTADVFLDCSVYQAFGRTGLEAMACGAVPVLPIAGGASEFAEDGRNAVLVDTADLDAVVHATADLPLDRPRLAKLSAQGVRDASWFTPERAALTEYTLFVRSLQNKMSAERVR